MTEEEDMYVTDMGIVVRWGTPPPVFPDVEWGEAPAPVYESQWEYPANYEAMWEEMRRRVVQMERSSMESPPPQHTTDVGERRWHTWCDKCGCNTLWSPVLEDYVCVCKHCYLGDFDTSDE